VSGPKDKKHAPGRESGAHKARRVKEKLIRLDDLIPKEDVLGGRQLLFGATPLNQTTNKRKES
jgi:hypothetical protein